MHQYIPSLPRVFFIVVQSIILSIFQISQDSFYCRDSSMQTSLCSNIILYQRLEWLVLVVATTFECITYFATTLPFSSICMLFFLFKNAIQVYMRNYSTPLFMKQIQLAIDFHQLVHHIIDQRINTSVLERQVNNLQIGSFIN